MDSGVRRGIAPAGDPEEYCDIDDGPAKTYLLENRDKYPDLFDLAVGKRPEMELYDVSKSMDCLKNLADVPEHRDMREQLKAKLTAVLTEQKDPRAIGTGDVFDSYPRFGAMRPKLGGFAKQGAYNPNFQK